jgi:hypothetical protein
MKNNMVKENSNIILVAIVAIVAIVAMTFSFGDSNSNNHMPVLEDMEVFDEGDTLAGEVVFILDYNITNATNTSNRIAYWWGKVNQHTENGVWKTDPDGRSGANINKLTYCKKWYPNTNLVLPYKMEKIKFYTAGNRYAYVSTKLSYLCVEDHNHIIV